jgi:hypothetical protein
MAGGWEGAGGAREGSAFLTTLTTNRTSMEILMIPKTVSLKLIDLPASQSSSSLGPDLPPWKRSPFARMSDAELLAHLDELVLDATRGDRRAVGAIAFAFTSDLRAEANAVLRHEHDAADVVQDFFLALLEGKAARFAPGRGRAKAFLLGVVRDMARRRRKDRRLQ